MQWGREYGKEEGTERTFEESGWVKTGDSSAYVKDGRHKIGSRRKGRKEQIEVQVHSEQRQPQSWNMLVFISSKGTRRDLEAAEMGTQETQSLIFTPPTWSKSQRIRLTDLSWQKVILHMGAVIFSLTPSISSIPHPLTTHTIAIACLGCLHWLCPTPILNFRKKQDTATTETVCGTHRGCFCRLGMKSAWRTCEVQSLHSPQCVLAVNATSFSEQLLSVFALERTTTHQQTT